MNNLNLILRFLLEVIAFLSPAFWVASNTEGWIRLLSSCSITLVLAAIWGVFAVPNDPSRSGKTVVNTPGWIRLILELAIFGFGGWCIWELGYEYPAYTYLAVVTIHNMMFWERNRWLLKQ